MDEDLNLLDDVIKDIRYKLRRKEICKKYKYNNPEKVKESNKKWAQKNKIRRRLLQNNRREKRRVESNKQKYEKQLTKNSPFVRVFMSVSNSKKRQCFITVDDIREQYEKQNGMCAVSGLRMRLPRSSGDRCLKTPDVISVDRIDSKKEYTKDNIQIICVSLNYAKNSFSNEEFLNFLTRLRVGNLAIPVG